MTAKTIDDQPATAATPSLRRELRFPETAALSIGVMAPTLAMSVTGIAAATELGRAAPLAFVFAGLGVGLVAYGFVRLAAEFSHAGSVYAFVGNALSPRVGFVAGWILLGTYLVFPPVSIMGIATFGRAFLHSTGLADDADWFPIALAGWAAIWLLAALGIRPTTRFLLVFEIVSVLLILVLVVAIYVRLAAGTRSATGGGGLSGEVFTLPPGVGVSTLALAATSGFLAFAGFESAASLGEESLAPRRAIPRAIVTSVVFGAVFYVACMVAQSLGFGTDAAGVAAFRGSEAPLGDLADHYVGSTLATLLDAGAVLSAVGAGLGGVIVAARMMFAFGRDGLADRRLGDVTPRTRALALEMVISLVLLVSFRLAGTPALNVFFYLATLGVLCLLVMYVLTNLAAAWHLSRRSWHEVVLPLTGTAVAGFVLYHNIWPVPAPPYRYFPYAVAGWIILGLAITIAVPGFVARVSCGLALRADSTPGPGIPPPLETPR
ncbi:MAG TPA: APC family permease [Jatrophihabitantaceae bacterium]|jgi:amino acid transporter